MTDNTIVSLFGREREVRQPARRIDLAHEANLQLGPVKAIPSRRLMAGPAGDTTLEPKVMQVLVALAREPGTIHSRDDLIKICWEGRIVGDASINRVISLLRTAFRDVGGEAVTIETVPKVGYRVMVDGAADIPHSAETGPPSGEPDLTSTRARWPLVAAGLAVLLTLIAATAWFIRPAAADETLRIAMVPLQREGDIDALFVRGFESALRSELARGAHVEVTSSETASILASGEDGVRALAKALDADMVWRGTLSRDGKSIALNSQLLFADDGDVSWEERIVGSEAEPESLPVRAARAMLRQIGREPTMGSRSAMSEPDDYALYLTAVGMTRSRDPSQLSAAARLLHTIVERNSRFAEGYSALAKATFLDADSQGRDVAQREREAGALARRALELDPGSAEATKVMAMLASDPRSRFDLISKAVEMDGGDGEAWLWFSHITAHPDYDQHEPRAMRRLVALDPLWGRTWQAGNIVAQHEGIAAGIELEQRIIDAAAEEWQADAARARIAAMRGDLSESYRLMIGAIPAMQPGQQQISGMQLANYMLLMGLQLNQPRPAGPAGLIVDVTSGRLPSAAEFATAGLDGENFWAVAPLVIAGPSLFIKEGREDELLALYDAAFANPADLVEFSNTQLYSHRYRTNIATYVALAMKRAGRMEEAKALLQVAERSVARWKAKGEMAMTPLLFEANLAAVQGDDARAVRALEAMIGYGYPYILQSPGVPLTGVILDDPAWDALRDDPRVRRLVAPIKANLERERAEIEAVMTT